MLHVRPGRDRLTSPDLIRGVAVLGILPANVPQFIGSYSPTWPDRLARAAGFFSDTKMVTTLAVLFGSGLAIQEGSTRARSQLGSFRLAYPWCQADVADPWPDAHTPIVFKGKSSRLTP